MSSKTILKLKHVHARMRLLHDWGFTCIVCGREFTQLSAVTREHIIPQSLNKGSKQRWLVAPSHFKCNSLRGNSSLISSSKKINELLAGMAPADAVNHLNKRVPGTVVPEWAELLFTVEYAKFRMKHSL